jgi:hypothetical protein
MPHSGEVKITFKITDPKVATGRPRRQDVKESGKAQE